VAQLYFSPCIWDNRVYLWYLTCTTLVRLAPWIVTCLYSCSLTLRGDWLTNENNSRVSWVFYPKIKVMRAHIPKSQEKLSYEIVIYVIHTTNCIILYHKLWPHVSTNYMLILMPLMHMKPKLQVKISFWVRIRSQSVVQLTQITFKSCLKIISKKSIKAFMSKKKAVTSSFIVWSISFWKEYH